MLQETGYCAGVENYSRHLSGRAAGERPSTLLDYFLDDYLLMVDESHQTVPQIGSMWKGDRSRKEGCSRPLLPNVACTRQASY